MKYFTYLAISVMVIAVISLFYLKKPDGQTWLSGSTISKEQMVALSTNTLNQAVKGIHEAGDKVTSSISSDSSTITSSSTIYKWQDETGQWHYSDSPNPHGKSIELTLNPEDITVIGAEDTSILNLESSTSEMSANTQTPSILSPESIKKLFEEAENIEKKLEKRNKEINNLSVL